MGIIEKKGKIGRTREGGGEGGMESESVRRERRMESARGRVHLTSGRARVHTQQFWFLVFSVLTVDFLSAFADQFQLSSNTIKLLKEKVFDCETAVLGLSEKNIEDLEGLKLGERAALHVAAASLQSKARGGPLVPVSPRPSATPEDSGRGVVDDIAQRLEGLSIRGGGSRNATQGEPPLKIVDFLSPTLVAEEEVALGGGVTLKINSKPKLEKVSLAMWVVANTRMMKAMMARPEFCVEQYLTYMEMIGELACRFTWTSVLLFDEEYRQRQAAVGFPWGTEAPYLSTVLLRDRQQGAASSTQQHRPHGQGQGGHRARPLGATGREICLQFNTRGVCAFGNKCNFEHTCLTCGRDDHPSWDHASAGGLRGGPGSTSGSRGAPTAHSTA